METIITAVIIDDQQDAIDDLQYLIEKEKLPVQVLATANLGQDGLVAILQHKPKLVFLDVVMPRMSGFEMLNLLPSLDFHLIITTSDNQYAIQAIRSSALDFLLKPIKASELIDAVTRAIQKHKLPDKAQLDVLEKNLQAKSQPITKIALPTAEGVELVNIKDILYLESDGNYTTVHLAGDKSTLVSKPLGKFEEMVDTSGFFRVHHSYLINLHRVSKYVRSDGGYVVLENGKTISVARNRKDLFLEALANI